MSETDPTIQRLARASAWTAGWVAASGAAALGFANHAHAETTLGAHNVSVSPSWDGFATIEGYENVDIRYPVEEPLNIGAHITLKNTPNPDSAIQLDTLIAANPKGELSNIGRITRGLLVESGEEGAVLGLFVVGSLYAISRRRQHEVLAHSDHFPATKAIGCLILGGSVVLMGNNLVSSQDTQPQQWTKLTSLIPELNNLDDQRTEKIEITQNKASVGAVRLINSAIDAYQTARVYYGNIKDSVPTVVDQIRQPNEGEVVALLISDRHDNILMDPVAKAIGDAGGATMVIDAGDDTSSGESWEAFSINSLNETFKHYKYRVGIAGNHDEGPFVASHLKKLGWTMLDNKITEVNSISFLGGNDPRSSGLGNWKDEKHGSVTEQAAHLAETACKTDKQVSTLVTHSPYSGTATVKNGCVKLALSGHMHVQLGPDSVIGANGEDSVSYTNGTTGGAAYAMALGTKLRRDAEVTLITYKDGSPVGIQPVMINSLGNILVQNYWQLPADGPSITAAKQAIRKQ
jgi:hypothetical protein